MIIRDLTANGASSPTTSNNNNAQVSPSIVVIIIVLTIIFFLSAFLHLLIRWLARNPRARGRSINGGSRSTIVTLTALQGQLQQLFRMQDSGIEQALINALPVFAYKTVMSTLKEGADCAICLSEFQVEDQLRLLPSCSHAFHVACVDTWLLSHSTCPLCRTALRPECWISEGDLGSTVLDSSRRQSSSTAHTQLPPLHESLPCSADDTQVNTQNLNAQVIDEARNSLGQPEGCATHSQRSLGGVSVAFTEGASSFISINEDMLERGSSILGSERRVPVKLGKCRFSERGQHTPVRHDRGASASDRFRSKGSYDYVLSDVNVELVMCTDRLQLAKSRRIDLAGCLALECSEDRSITEATSSCWGTASFRKLKSAEEKRVMSQSSSSANPNASSRCLMREKLSMRDILSIPETSQKVAVGVLDEVGWKQESGLQRAVENLDAVGLKLGEHVQLPSNRAVSFSHTSPAGRFRQEVSASRRALSEDEAFAFWSCDCMVNALENCNGVNNGSGELAVRSSSFARRTMEWLMGWPKRTVHPHDSSHATVSPEAVLP